MTIKEIAELTGKSTRSVRTWVKLTSEESSNVLEKSSNADKIKKPADFNLDETIQILKAGNISEILIDLLIKNANETTKSVTALQPIQNEQVAIQNEQVNKIESILSDFMSKLIEKISTQNLIESPKQTRKNITIQEVLGIVNKSEKSIMTAALMINRDENGIYTKVHDAIRGKVLYFTFEEISIILTYLKVSPKIIDIFKY
jgi:predicted transcriptional regulator